MAADTRSKPTPLSYSIKGAAEATGISTSLLEQFIARGDITPKYVNSKRVITADELQAWLDSLPIERGTR
jgi:hypothetical protein